MRPSDRPRFSFLTTAYKTEAYLGATIDSVVAQSDANWELVIVDNGNDDDIAAIVASFAHDPRITLLRQENRGYVGGVMAAAAEAHGDFLCVLDSDDQLMPDFVRTMSAYLEAHPGVAAVGCDAHEFSDDEQDTSGQAHLRAIGVRRVSPGGEVLTVKDVLRGRVPFYTGAISRESWDRVGGYRPGAGGGDPAVLLSLEASDEYEPDVLLWLELSSQFDVRLIPERLARYRVRPTSLSRGPERIEQFEKSLIGTFERFAESSGRADYQALVQAPVSRLRYQPGDPPRPLGVPGRRRASGPRPRPRGVRTAPDPARGCDPGWLVVAGAPGDCCLPRQAEGCRLGATLAPAGANLTSLVTRLRWSPEPTGGKPTFGHGSWRRCAKRVGQLRRTM